MTRKSVIFGIILLLFGMQIIPISGSAENITYYNKSISPFFSSNEDNLVIIAPEMFSTDLQSLINHKNDHGITTILKTVEEVYSEYEGRDNQEKIKYFIKDAIENLSINYVLLVGGVDQIPIRECCISFESYVSSVLSDLYYADIYDENQSFCSWDSDNDEKYAEYYDYNHPDNDKVDLYPDVCLGRLACSNNREVINVVRKIIHYETQTYGEDWFNNIVLMGGDSHIHGMPGYEGNEGEYENLLIEQIMCDFTSTRIWASQGNFNARSINQAIRKGAGFVHYSGHGSRTGVQTHPPNNETWVTYHTKNLITLFNKNKLPIVWLSACATAWLDFKYYEQFNNTPIIELLLRTLYKATGYPSYFAWNWMRKTNGGAIAVIGSTRGSFGGAPNASEVSGLLALKFFEAYNTSSTVGEMFAQAQTDFRNNASWGPPQYPNDFCRWNHIVLEEFVLLGDPSLKIGGYPT